MKQKNFSEVPSGGKAHSPLWASVNGSVASLLPKCSLVTLLLLVAFLFPSSVMAQTGIPVADQKIPASAVFKIKDVPAIKTVEGASETFTVTISDIMKLSSFAPISPSPVSGWPIGTAVVAGDFYQVTYTIAAKPGYGFLLPGTGVPLFPRELPNELPSTNWGTSDQATIAVEVSRASGLVVLQVVYRVPKTIESGHRVIDTHGAFSTGANTLSAQLKVGTVIPTTALRSNTTEATSQWTGALTWTIGSTTVPTANSARFPADSVNYTAHVDLKAAQGYTFDGLAAGAMTWATTDAESFNRTSNLANAAREVTATFRAFSRYPAKEISSNKLSAGAASSSIYPVYPRGTDTPSGWSWDKGMLTWSGVDYFLPDSVYTLTINIKATIGADPWVAAGATNIAYGFAGTPAGYFTAGENVQSVSSANKTTVTGSSTFNTDNTIKITFPKTESLPGTGNVIIEQPIPGTGNTYKVGDILQTTIPGASTAIFDGWYDGGSLAVEAFGTPKKDTIFKANKTYELRFRLVADEGYTFFADALSTDFTEKYTAGDSTAVRTADVALYKEVRYNAFFKTPSTLPNGTLGVPHPIGGMKTGDRKEIPTGTPGGTLLPNIDGYEIEWYEVDGTTLTLLDDADVFKPETKYTARVILTPKPRYTMFNSATTSYTYYQPLGELNPTLGPSGFRYPALNSILESRSHRLSSDTVTYNFYPTANSLKKPNMDTIRSLATAFVAPVAGASPVTSVTGNGGTYRAEIEWSEGGTPLVAGAKFEAAKVYTAKLTVKGITTNWWSVAGVEASSFFVPAADPDKYHLIAEEPIVISTTENKAVATYEFAPTESLITIKDLEFVDTDFIFPTSGWAKTSYTKPNVGIDIPAPGDKIVDNDEYTAVVDRWEWSIDSWATFVPINTVVFSNNGFVDTGEYCVTLRVDAKDGYTVFGLDKEVAYLAANVGTWAKYPAGGAQVEKVLTYTTNMVNGFIEVQVYFKVAVPAIVQLDGFPAAGRAVIPATKASLIAANPLVTITDVKLSNASGGPAAYLSAQGGMVNDTVYVYTIKLDPTTGYTTVGLGKDKLVTVNGADSVKHAANDLSTLEVYFSTTGDFARDYEIEIEVPATGEFPATGAHTSEVSATNVSWTGIFSSGRFVKGNTYSAQVTLDNTTYSFYGVPANAFSVKDYPYAIVGNNANDNVVVIQFPTISNALVLTAPKFAWVNEGYGPIGAGTITIENNTALTYVIDNIVISGTEFRGIPGVNADTIKALETNTAWQVVPNVGIAKGNHTATLTLYYHVAGAAGNIFQTDATVSLNVYAVGVTTPEAGELSAYGLGGVLTLKGLVAGEPYSIHNAQGVLIYRGVAKSDEATVNAPVKGVYVVTSAGKTLKVINK